ncbi:microtubule-actin cross-linking factor 1-like isoform X1 [Lates japonicus]|uniref:Microtubule-actin cross-linking factor 1-like isoform X1 n=1 Tax=Lates japonicus TaxID=270547 RepID=A0AAD3NQ35_LATJO|nr:microtubule-actin cross-linking factor 1-like isoform X1 [Lates japonicus]
MSFATRRTHAASISAESSRLCSGALGASQFRPSSGQHSSSWYLTNCRMQPQIHNLHTKSTELGGRLSGLLERYQQYQDEALLSTPGSAPEQN